MPEQIPEEFLLIKIIKNENDIRHELIEYRSRIMVSKLS